MSPCTDTASASSKTCGRSARGARREGFGHGLRPAGIRNRVTGVRVGRHPAPQCAGISNCG
eukprot:14008174-Alexandrium_andersonii.AAC.1